MKVNFTSCVCDARKGNADAFAKLYSLIYKDLYYIALCNLKNSHDAADVVSDTVLDAFISIKKLKDINAFKAWIIKILSIKIKKKLSENISFRDNTTEIYDDIPQKNTNLDDRYLGLEIIQQINQLNENERLAFSLSIICGYSSQEISEITGINSATVRSHLLRGREKLKKQLSV